MSSAAKIIIASAAIILIVLVILFLLGQKRLKTEKANDKNFEELIKDGKYAAVRCLIKSDVIYHDRVSLGKEQKKHLEYLDGLVALCGEKIKEKNINETKDLGKFLLSIIPDYDYVQFQFMLKYCGPDINFQDDNGTSLLMAACQHKRMNIIRYLLEAKAEINAANKDGKTALAIACNNADYETVKLLLKYKADVKHTDNSGKKMIEQIPSDADDFVKIVSLLTEHGAAK